MKIDLWEFLPAHVRRADDTGDLARFASVLQKVTDSWTASVDAWPSIFDLTCAPSPFLELILEDLGNPFSLDLPLLAKRRLAAVLVEMYRQKGTAPGIANVIRFFLGVEAKVTAYAEDTLSLGESELGHDFVLGPAGTFPLYAFDVSVARVLTPEERRQVRAIVGEMKPAHTHFTGLLEPLPAVPDGHWILGVGLLGEDSGLQ